MKKQFTIKDILTSAAGHLNKHLSVETQVVKQSKYKNTRTMVDGIKFDSIREANRYKVLKLLLKSGNIGFLKLQVPFELNPGGTFSFIYVADFVYIDSSTGNQVIEDSKGMLTREYKKKRRLMKKIHNITIKET